MKDYRDSRINRDRREDSFARAVIAEAERRRQVEDQPLGDCPHCSSAYHDEHERQYHADAECIGEVGRFR